MTDYKTLYDDKCQEHDELNEQFLEYQNEYDAIINDLEKQNKEIKHRVSALQLDHENLKEKKKTQINSLEKQLEMNKREKNDFKTKFEEFQRKVIELENINETLQSETRAANCMLSEYQQRVEKTMEELALLQLELEECKESNQEQIARLKSQMKQTEEELYVIHLKHQKHNDESEHRRSRLSSASFSSQEEPNTRTFSDVEQTEMKKENNNTENDMNANVSNLISMNFKRNKEASFQNTIGLVTNLINELDNRAKKIRAKKKVAV